MIAQFVVIYQDFLNAKHIQFYTKDCRFQPWLRRKLRNGSSDKNGGARWVFILFSPIYVEIFNSFPLPRGVNDRPKDFKHSPLNVKNTLAHN